MRVIGVLLKRERSGGGVSKVAEKGRARFRIPEGGINPCLFPIRASSIQSRGGSNHIFRPKGTIRVDANQPYRSNANSAARFTALSNRRLRPQTTRLLAATIKRGSRFEEVSTRGKVATNSSFFFLLLLPQSFPLPSRM